MAAFEPAMIDVPPETVSFVCSTFATGVKRGLDSSELTLWAAAHLKVPAAARCVAMACGAARLEGL